MYNLEEELVCDFVDILKENKKPFDSAKHSREFNFRSGRTDIILHNEKNKIIAVEAKLKKWRDALHQAYRCSSFSHYSYVLLPFHTAELASKNIEEFQSRYVGLCTILNGKIKILIKAPYQKPIQPWLTKAARHFIIIEEDKINESNTIRTTGR